MGRQRGGGEEGDGLCAWHLPVENSCERFLRGTRAAILAVARWMTKEGVSVLRMLGGRVALGFQFGIT